MNRVNYLYLTPKNVDIFKALRKSTKRKGWSLLEEALAEFEGKDVDYEDFNFNTRQNRVAIKITLSDYTEQKIQQFLSVAKIPINKFITVAMTRYLMKFQGTKLIEFQGTRSQLEQMRGMALTTIKIPEVIWQSFKNLAYEEGFLVSGKITELILKFLHEKGKEIIHALN